MILLDTHAALWLLISPEQLSHRAREAILRARKRGEPLTCSSVSIYEIANSVRRGRLRLYVPTQRFIEMLQTKVSLAAITPEIGLCAGELPEPFHGDPMDRIITATAIVGDLTLITRDHRIHLAGLCRCLW